MAFSMRANDELLVKFEWSGYDHMEYVIYKMYPDTDFGTITGSGTLVGDENVFLVEAAWLMVKCWSQWPMEMVDPAYHYANPALRRVVVMCSLNEWEDDETHEEHQDFMFYMEMRELDGDPPWHDYGDFHSFGVPDWVPSWSEVVERECVKRGIDTSVRQVS